MDDLNLLLESAGKRYPEVPLVFYGHSLGGNLVLNYALRQEHDLQAVIATGPWLRLAFEPPPIKILLGRLMNRLYPAFSQPSGLDTAALSHDPAVVATYEADPLVHDRISARLFMGIHTAGLWALEHAGSLHTPTLLMHGTEDRLTSAQASEEFARRAGEICTLRLWEGLFHEIHNEPEKEEVIAEILSWLDDHL
jgi:alpha-beta hydrolase superfamily lysophospholipase